MRRGKIKKIIIIIFNLIQFPFCRPTDRSSHIHLKRVFEMCNLTAATFAKRSRARDSKLFSTAHSNVLILCLVQQSACYYLLRENYFISYSEVCTSVFSAACVIQCLRLSHESYSGIDNNKKLRLGF